MAVPVQGGKKSCFAKSFARHAIHGLWKTGLRSYKLRPGKRFMPETDPPTLKLWRARKS